MASGRSISTKVSIKGEKQYKAAITSINSELRVLKSEMTAVTAEFQQNANSEAALSSKMETLTRTLDKQKEKVKTLSDAVKAGKQAQENWKTTIEQTKKDLQEANDKISTLDKSTANSGKQWNEYKTKLDAANQEMKALKATEGDTTEQQNELQAEIDQLKAEMGKLNESTGRAAEETGKLYTKQAELNKNLTTQEGKLQSATEKTNRWQIQLNNARATEANLNVETQKTKKYLDEAKQSTDHCATSIDKFGKETKEAAEGVGKVGDAFQTLSSLLMTVGLARGIKKIVDILKECVEVSADFHYTLATVQATGIRQLHHFLCAGQCGELRGHGPRGLDHNGDAGLHAGHHEPCGVGGRGSKLYHKHCGRRYDGLWLQRGSGGTLCGRAGGNGGGFQHHGCAAEQQFPSVRDHGGRNGLHGGRCGAGAGHHGEQRIEGRDGGHRADHGADKNVRRK